MERLLLVEADPCFAVMIAFDSPLTMVLPGSYRCLLIPWKMPLIVTVLAVLEQLQFDYASVQNSEKLA